LFSDCNGISLLNVLPEIFFNLQEKMDSLVEAELCGKLCGIKSLNQLHPILLEFELPFLDKLEFDCELDSTSLQPHRKDNSWQETKARIKDKGRI